MPPLRLLGLHLVGAACGRSVLRHLVWTFGGFVMLESTLSYLGGFGVREPVPSWGNMLVFEWGREVSAASVAPALALWTTAVATAAAARVFAEVPDA